MEIYDEKYWKEPCPRVDYRKKDCLCGLKAVIIPSALGDDSEGSEIAPKNGAYCNAIVKYEANGHIYIYSKEGIPTRINTGEGGGAVYFDELLSRPSYAGRPMTSTTSIPDVSEVSAEVASVRTVAQSALQPEDINYTVLDDLDFESNPSTSLVQMDASLVNLQSGATSSKVLPFPVASTTQAGVMNSATFDAITENSNSINALLNGAVAVSGLSAAPTQAELTTAWQAETGLTTLINRAQILDSTNSKIWTYYTNDSTWHEAPAGGTVSINTFTNSSEGVIKGSTNVGQVFAENDGTGSVNGWDSLSSEVSGNTANKLASANLTASGGLSKTTTGSGASTEVDISIAADGVTTAKIADGAVTSEKIDFSTMKRWIPDYANKGATNLWGSSNTATMTEDGFIYYQANYYSLTPTNSLFLRINGKVMDKASALMDINSNRAFIFAGVLPVSAGDIVMLDAGSLTMSERELYFVPGRWI